MHLANRLSVDIVDISGYINNEGINWLRNNMINRLISV